MNAVLAARGRPWARAAARATGLALGMVVATLTVTTPAQARERVPLPAGVAVVYSACPGAVNAGGCAYTDAAAIAAGAYGEACRNRAGCIYLSARDPFIRYHELAHVWDRQVLTDADRAWFTRRLGYAAGTPWRSQRSGAHSPGERFADAYANCALAHYAKRWATAYGYAYRARRHRDVCNAINLLGLLRR